MNAKALRERVGALVNEIQLLTAAVNSLHAQIRPDSGRAMPQEGIAQHVGTLATGANEVTASAQSLLDDLHAAAEPEHRAPVKSARKRATETARKKR